MKVSDYIVAFLAGRGITDVFGYPGGMVTHLMDSLDKAAKTIRAHVTYHEQGAAFAACGYAGACLRPGVAYATSGPGATNLITGIANAYFDSTPVIFLTGQVNTYESKGGLPVRQRGFQEMDVVALTQSITKYSVRITQEADIRYHLEKAYWYATEGRNGPVVLDIPMNIQRMEVEPEQLRGFEPPVSDSLLPQQAAEEILRALQRAKRPCLVAGAGIQASGTAAEFRRLANIWGIPVVSSMLAVDILPENPYYYGFIGAYGMRHANWILSKSDTIISLGSRLDLRQIGIQRESFAPNANWIRVDVDPAELSYPVHPDETALCADLRELIPLLAEQASHWEGGAWLESCNHIRSRLSGKDDTPSNTLVAALSKEVAFDVLVTTDVGQNQVWVAQSFCVHDQRILFSGGHGAMGYSLPAAIGAHYATGNTVLACTGDGGLQMNLQELQFLAREQIPVKILLLNNHSLGMIRHFQEMYFDSNYTQTKKEKGYTTPDFQKLAQGFGLPYLRVTSVQDTMEFGRILRQPGPALIEAELSDTTYVFPKSSVGKPMWMQEPPLNDAVQREIEDI